MTLHRAINIALTLATVIVLVLTLSVSHLLDDHHAEWRESGELQDAIKHAQQEARRDRAAAQLCIRLRGPGAAPMWDENGSLVCSARRGPGRTLVADSAGLAK